MSVNATGMTYPKSAPEHTYMHNRIIPNLLKTVFHTAH